MCHLRKQIVSFKSHYEFKIARSNQEPIVRTTEKHSQKCLSGKMS